MINLYGVDFLESEVQVVTIGGEPTWVVNEDGMRRLCRLKGVPEAETDDLMARIRAAHPGAA